MNISDGLIRVLTTAALGVLASATIIAQGPDADPVRTTPVVRFDLEKRALKIPIELDNNLIIIPVRVNDSQPLRFIFDTGASISIISPKRASGLGLKTEGQVSGAATGGAIEGTLIKGVSFTVPGVTVSNQLIAAIDFGGSDTCFPFDGVIGYDFITSSSLRSIT